MVGVQDCGLPLNRRAVQSQLNGGMIQGLGYALLEEHWVDMPTGNMLNATMDEYKLPGTMEIPEMVALIDDGDTREVVIGMAEPAAIPGASAIANAVFNAIGVRITSLPITPDKILTALAKG
jgi:xanthine dehydrogenase YagR molybdenum-binding subunit